MALLKKKHSILGDHSRKSSQVSAHSNSGCSTSTRNSSGTSITGTPGSQYISTNSSYTGKECESNMNSNLHLNTNLKVETTRVSPHSPSSRLSSAPVFSGGKRLSLALRSFSSSTSSNNGPFLSRDDNTQTPTGAMPQVDNLSRHSSYTNSGVSNQSGSKDDLSDPTCEDNKLIFDWDVTDPTQWTSQRVISWLQLNDFSSRWISFFTKLQISGNDFLKLMAYENFQKHEPLNYPSNTSSYKRFQHLLKKTMEQNVIHLQHSYSKSNGSMDSVTSKRSSKHLRTDSGSSSSASYNHQHKKSQEQPTIILDRCDDGAELTATKSQYDADSTHAANNHHHDDVSHQKSKGTGSLYRRSFISLRNSVSPSSSSTKQTLNAPSKTDKKTKPVLNIPATTPLIDQKVYKGSSANTPSNYFTRHQKTTSTDSFHFNTIFKPSGNNSSSTTPVEDTFDKKPLDKTLQHLSTASSTTANSSSGSRSHPKHESKILINEKFLPHREQPICKKYILVTKDRLSFFPLDISGIVEPSNFQSKLSISCNIHHKNYQVFLTDFEFNYGENPLDDQTIEILFKNDFSNGWDKFFIKDLLKIQLRHTRSSSSLAKRKASTKSAASSVKSSTTDSTSTHNSSELGSLEETLVGKQASLKTPNHYYDAQESIDYANTKEENRNTKSLNKVSTRGVSSCSSFKVIRPDDTHKIDFNQKRDSPFVKLEPKREAPKPPLNKKKSSSSIKDRSIISMTSKKSPHLLKRPPPPSIPLVENISSMGSTLQSQKKRDHESDSTISAFTPGSSQILVPQPYKGTFGDQKEMSAMGLPKKPSLLTLRKRSSTTSIKAVEYSSTKLNRSNSSIQSSLNSVFQSPPRFLQRKSSRRVISSASSADVFDENKISFTDAPPLSDDESPDLKIKDSFQVDDESGYVSAKEDALFSFPITQENQEFESDGSSDSDGIAWVGQKTFEGYKNTKKGECSKDDDDDDDDDGIAWAQTSITSSNHNQHTGNNYSADSSEEEQDLVAWKNNTNEPSVTEEAEADDSIVMSLNQESPAADAIARKMTLRPSPDVVYQNLEMFFPGTDLDKPVLEGASSPATPNFFGSQTSQNKSAKSPVISASTIQHSTENDDYSFNTFNSLKTKSEVGKLKPPKRAKTIRMVAHEAQEARKKTITRKLKRHNTTKLWGTKVVEITSKENIVAINKKRNSKGEYKEFAWLKGEMIGKGSFGCVYIGLNITTGEMMAIKQVEVPKYRLHDESVNNVVDALKMEVSTLKDLDHLNIVQYLGFEKKTTVYSLFLEYVAGGSVGSLIRLNGRFDDATIRFLTQQVLEGLSYLHSQGILHRDMKADNLLLDLDGVCKISDFGISRKSDNIYCNEEMTMRGTVFWMAPEMVDTKQGYSAKVDIWSLGCIVLEMFAGKRPWSNLEVVAAMFKIGKYKSAPPIPDDTLPLISQAGRDFLNSCFEIDPEKRPTANDLLKTSLFKESPEFKFSDTALYQFINNNNKMNSDKMHLEI